MKTVALYSPYVPKHSGGGERYLLSIAQVASNSCDTYLLVSPTLIEETKKALHRYERLFGLHLEKVKVKGTSIGQGKSPLNVFRETRSYDTFFAMTDGSIFPVGCSNAHLIVQVPWTRSLSLTERIKLKMWKDVLVYSHFVKDVISSSWKTSNIAVLSPYVKTQDFHPVGKKEKIILSVGRFFAHRTSNSKRQDVLIDAYKELMQHSYAKGWSLVLIGNVEDRAYLEQLKAQARGYHVVFATNIGYDELRAYCARASIYWHAAGYQVDEVKHPENTEHFGITTLEAMASGCVPLVVPKGGQKEILKEDRYFWQSIEELVAQTSKFIKLSTQDMIKEQAHVVELASVYSFDHFERKVSAYL